MNIKEHDIFKDCATRIHDQCYARFAQEREEMDEYCREIAESRLAQEMDILERSGLFHELYLMMLIDEFAKARHRFVVIHGLPAYSYTVYLLGITDVNPITAYFPLIRAYPYQMNKLQTCKVYVPEGFDADIVDHLKQLFGDALVRKEESQVILGNLTEQDKDYKSHTIRIQMLNDDLITKLNRKMASTGRERNITCKLQRLDDNAIQAQRLLYEERKRKRKNILIKNLLEKHATSLNEFMKLGPIAVDKDMSTGKIKITIRLDRQEGEEKGEDPFSMIMSLLDGTGYNSLFIVPKGISITNAEENRKITIFRDRSVLGSGMPPKDILKVKSQICDIVWGPEENPRS